MQQAILHCFPAELQEALQRMPPQAQETLQEIRLRSGRPLAVRIGRDERFLCKNGMLTDFWQDAIRVQRQQIESVFRAACEYSVYRYQREIAEGYLTMKGGSRIGICGTAVYRDRQYVQMRDINGLNIRIARQVKDCARSLTEQTCHGTLSSVLLAGSVGSGKTTLLRDMCRILGQTHRLCIIDTRGEIAAVQNGIPQYEVGLHTDVYDGFPRVEGAVMALRVMTPDGLVCDEISTMEEAEALMQVHGCGIRILATAHAATMEDINRRPCLRTLLEAGVFEYVALLHHGTVQNIRRIATC